MARRRSDSPYDPPTNRIRFSSPWDRLARGGLIPRREIPINPGQPEEYRYRLNLCVIGRDGGPVYRRIEYDSPVQIRPETLQLVITTTLTDIFGSERGTYRHGGPLTRAASNQPCGATVESITRRS